MKEKNIWEFCISVAVFLFRRQLEATEADDEKVQETKWNTFEASNST